MNTIGHMSANTHFMPKIRYLEPGWPTSVHRRSRTRRTCRLDSKTPRSETKPHPGHMRELWWRPRSDPRKDHVQDAAGSEKRAGGDRHQQQRDVRGNRRELRQHDKTQGGWDSRHLDGTRRVGGRDAALCRHHRQCEDCVVYEGRFRFCSHKKRHRHDCRPFQARSWANTTGSAGVVRIPVLGMTGTSPVRRCSHLPRM